MLSESVGASANSTCRACLGLIRLYEFGGRLGVLCAALLAGRSLCGVGGGGVGRQCVGV